MTKDEALDLALEALEALGASCLIVRDDMLADKIQQAITALREELAQPENGEKCHDCGGMGYQDGIGDRCPTCNGFGQQPEQKPVAWQWLGSAHFRKKLPKNADITAWNPLYTTPPKREWVGLTDDEIEQGCKESWVTEQAFQSAVWWAETKLTEKNT